MSGVFYLLLLACIYTETASSLQLNLTSLLLKTAHPVVRMHILLLVVLYAAQSCANSDSSQDNIQTLMDNVLVLRVPHDVSTRVNVNLTCGGAYQNQPVFWKKNGVLQSALQGNQVTVMVEEMDGGNYTCHLSPDGECVNHTVILTQLEPDNKRIILVEQSPEEGHIHCSAPNYKGSFHCTWKKGSRSNAAVLLVKAERNLERIPCVLDADGLGVQCQDANCPYNEEKHRILLTVYIHSHARLEAYMKAFYLREIVVPAALPNLSITDGKVFSWSYPDSWEKPCTFFGLKFQVKMVHIGHTCNSEEHMMQNTTEETEFEVNLKTRRYAFCVRAQDKYTNGPFSPWSHCTVNKHVVTC